jgi:hypothetical protein
VKRATLLVQGPRLVECKREETWCCVKLVLNCLEEQSIYAHGLVLEEEYMLLLLVVSKTCCLVC